MSPAPLVPAEVDLTDFQYMELDVRLLRDSKFAAQPDAEAFRAGVLLWCAAWHQVPAASLPDNDLELSNLAGYGRIVKEWLKVREQALALFVRCSDGRLYHRVIAGKAVAAWQAKLHHQHGKLLERLRKENKKREGEGLPPLPLPSFDQWNAGRSTPESAPPSAGIPAENALRGNRTEQNGEGTERNSLPLTGDFAGGAGAPAVAKTRKRRAPKAKAPAPTAATWDAYAEAYRTRYGELPVRNAKVNGQFAQVVSRLGADEAPGVARFFVGHQGQFYVRSMHSADMLLRDAEKLRTEWATNRQTTNAQAAMADRTQTNLNAFAPLLERAREAEAHAEQ